MAVNRILRKLGRAAAVVGKALAAGAKLTQRRTNQRVIEIRRP